MTPAHVELTLARDRLSKRLEKLRERLDGGDESVIAEYATVAASLATLLPALSPENGGRLLTTAELAARLGVSVKTVLSRRKAGKLTPAVELGQRGRAALRWKA